MFNDEGLVVTFIVFVFGLNLFLKLLILNISCRALKNLKTVEMCSKLKT